MGYPIYSPLGLPMSFLLEILAVGTQGSRHRILWLIAGVWPSCVEYFQMLAWWGTHSSKWMLVIVTTRIPSTYLYRYITVIHLGHWAPSYKWYMGNLRRSLRSGTGELTMKSSTTLTKRSEWGRGRYYILLHWIVGVFPCDLIPFFLQILLSSVIVFCQVCGMQNRRKTTLLIDLYTDMMI